MHRPVGAFLTIFAGAVDGVDDPHAVFAEAQRRVLAFLREDAVIGALLGQRFHQEGVGRRIARLAQSLALNEAAIARGEQDTTGGSGKLRGQFGIIGDKAGVFHQITGIQTPRRRSTINSAASSLDRRVVSICNSGFCGAS